MGTVLLVLLLLAVSLYCFIFGALGFLFGNNALALLLLVPALIGLGMKFDILPSVHSLFNR